MHLLKQLVLAGAALAALASPACAQRRADLAPSAEAAASLTGGRTAMAPGIMDPRLIAPAPRTAGAVEVRRMSTGGHVAVGALAGAVLGAALPFADPNCRKGESMCGLALVGTVPLGIVIGGGAGYLVSRAR
ncbi:MAG TPA: hypothetical protein VF665_06300 [Longimicrobium sp.]|jgi:hypothetical protein|uniref:hypothetical protein n=1 Tax=Longimicrobium sp. TaxID=2029185 RepID=UPI002ED9241B